MKVPISAAAERTKRRQKGDGEMEKRGIGGWIIAALIVLLPLGGALVLFRDQIPELWRPPATSASAGKTPGEKKILYWHDPMHPQYKSERPGKAPDCGMDLVPVYEGDTTGEQIPSNTFGVTPNKQQLIGVRFGEVTAEHLSRTIRAVGRLAYDETSIYRIYPKFDGWIEKVYVNFTGKAVERNQILLTAYSPELLASQEEYLLALKARERLGNNRYAEVAAGSESLLDAARRRLELWDFTDEQITRLEATRRPVKAVPVYASQPGLVIARNAYERQRITPETELYSIADLSRIWVIADIYESEAPEIRMGQPVTITLPYQPGRTLRGRINYIYPQLDPATRTLKVRAELPNPSHMLKPDMYVNVELRIDYGRRISVPQDAVLDSGGEQQVFVYTEGGYFEPRRVAAGPKIGDRIVVLDGLREGERIVVSGNFLIDAESRLKAAVSGMGPAADDQAGQPADHAQHQHAAPPAPAPQAADAMDHSQHQNSSPAQAMPVDHSHHSHTAKPQAPEKKREQEK